MPVERLEGFQTGRTAGEGEEEFKRGLLLTTLDRAVGWARKQSSFRLIIWVTSGRDKRSLPGTSERH